MSKILNIISKYLHIKTILKKKKKFTKTINTINTFIKLYPFFSCNNEIIVDASIKSIKIPLKRTLCSKLEEIEKFMHESVEIAYATNDPTVKLTLDLFRG